MSAPGIVSVASVKEWLSGGGPFPSTSDGLLARMIAAATQFAIEYLQKPLIPATFTERYNGNGQTALPLRQRPVILVKSLTIGTSAIVARTQPSAFGFVNDDQSVYLDGGWCGFGPAGYFVRGMQNIAVTYDAGFQTADTVTVPTTPFTVDTNTLARAWNADRGVAYATGVALTKVTSAPTIGQYQLSTDVQANVTYVFAAADVGASVVITYGYTPDDIAQAMIEWIGERYRARDRIGATSVNMGHGQVVSFSQKDMNASIKTTLAQYKNVVPV